MKYELHSHRHASTILEEPQFMQLWNELKTELDNISDKDLIKQYPISANIMSLSAAINDLIHERLVAKGWRPEAPIFQDTEYLGSDAQRWALDFAKDTISIEVAFNHGEAMAWNLLKPVMASELNHVRKAIQTKIGIVILATEELKKAGAFDGAVGTFEKALRYLNPMNNFLTVPMALIGLRAPKTFYVEKVKKGGKNRGVIHLKA